MGKMKSCRCKRVSRGSLGSEYRPGKAVPIGREGVKISVRVIYPNGPESLKVSRESGQVYLLHGNIRMKTTMDTLNYLEKCERDVDERRRQLGPACHAGLSIKLTEIEMAIGDIRARIVGETQ